MNIRSFGKIALMGSCVALCNPLLDCRAATELLLNGGFDLTTAGPNKQVVGGHGDSNAQFTRLSNWTTSNDEGKLTFVFTSTAADTVGANGEYYQTNRFKLWGPGTGVANGLGASPQGGNFLASDGAESYRVPISQTVAGLTIGQSYNLTFYWAAAQQYTFDGPTFEQWQVSFGGQTQTTPLYSLPNHGFSGWMSSSMTFSATSASSVLSFLALGTPNGLPPFLLLDGVSLTAVPEPTVAGLVVAALVGGAVLRRKWNKSEE